MKFGRILNTLIIVLSIPVSIIATMTPMAKAPSVPGFGMMCQSAYLAVRER